MQAIILVRGLPGSGKTSFAQQIENDCCEIGNTQIVCADDYFIDKDGNYSFNGLELMEAHSWCLERTRRILLSGESVVVHNTFTTEKEMNAYFELAKCFNCPIFTVIVENRHGSKSVHNVPEKTVQKMKDRFCIKL